MKLKTIQFYLILLILFNSFYCKIQKNSKSNLFDKILLKEEDLIKSGIEFGSSLLLKDEKIILASDGKADDYFGASLSISGNISITGSPNAEVGTTDSQGKAYIYENNGTYWNEKQILVASDGEADDIFALDTSISGNYSIICSPYAKVGANSRQGKVYFFENNGTYWNEKQILITSDGESGDYFGTSLLISGNYSLISSSYAKVGNNTRQGKVYFFENNGTYWNEKQILIASDGKADDYFGLGLSISGNISLIGSPYATVGNNTKQGKVYFFENNGTYWNEKQILITILFMQQLGNNTNQGKAYIFENNGTYWNEKQILIASDGESDDYFSSSLSISGNISFIGASYANVGNNSHQGKVYIYEKDENYWNEKQILIASDGEAENRFGYQIVVFQNYLLSSSPYTIIENSSNQGKVYSFEIIFISNNIDETTKTNSQKYLIIGLIIGIFILISLIIFIIFWKRRKRKTRSNLI
ncbi:hypothetical protein M0811_05147 [Anaeramoeba ignava]|uniref:Uncharacterized protein n=1 Tax=Anaeramoeba ignava TaxID=1746090 RepID=A0A9Q0RH37_ANAIG|nr:hypothetical protein M0811_05147 [Anaeramoeba ignava]